MTAAPAVAFNRLNIVDLTPPGLVKANKIANILNLIYSGLRKIENLHLACAYPLILWLQFWETAL